MNGLDINKFMSKKLAIAFYAIWAVGNAGASPTVTALCQSAIGIAAMMMIWLLDKGENHVEKTINNSVPG